MHFTTTSLAALAALSSTALGHVVLENPKPFKFPNYGPTNPLETDGSDFPCKKLPGQQLEMDGEPTVMVAGENQTLSFRGQAVHGGGSCQISLTTDLQPTPASRWMVIHSIEGGCPARNQKGNLEGPNQDEYQFVVPESFGTPEGSQMVLSWTWNNRISGSAEFYQNCAPVTIVGGSGKKSKRMSAADRRRSAAAKRAEAVNLPEMFMANLGDLTGGCTTDEAVKQQLSIAYPNPGPSVERPEGDEGLFQQTCDGNPHAGEGGAAPAPQPPASSASSSPAAPEPSSTTVAPPPATTVTTPIVVVTPPSAAPTDDASVQPPPPSTATSTAGPAPTGSACEVEGYLTCMEDGLGFKTCTGGKLRPDGEAIPVPPGYKCTPGSGQGLDLQPIE